MQIIPHWTTEGALISLVHTHLITGVGVQVVLFKDEMDHINMASPSCPVDHSGSIIVRAVEQEDHLWG